MTLAKRPLPSLRFVMYARPHTMRLIPQTTPKGKVLPNLWATPGGGIKNTEDLIELCRRQGWKYEIIGNDGSSRPGRRPSW